MRDGKLSALLIAVTVLVTGHNIDHLLRDDILSLPLSAQLIFAAVVGVIYFLIGVTFVLYRKGRIGPRYFTIVSLAGFSFGWFAHFSPYSDQTPRYILTAYDSATAGWMALAVLSALMLTLALTVLYAGYCWIRGAKL